MKNTLLLALFATVAVSMSSCSNNTTSTTSASETATEAAIQYNGNIAFIRMDSLMNSYGMFIDMNDEFNKKQAAAQKELENRGMSLQRQVNDYQDKAQKGLITRYQATSIEEEIGKKQQEIQAYQQKVMNQLGEEQAVMSAQISKVILDYLNEYNADKKYSLILQTMGGNPVILADPALDITADVLTVLNKRYADTLAKKK